MKEGKLSMFLPHLNLLTKNQSKLIAIYLILVEKP